MSRRGLSCAAAVLALALGLALGLGGCGLLGQRGPSAPARARSRTTLAPASNTGQPATGPPARAVARAEHTHELPTPAPGTRVSGGWRTPSAAVTSFAEVYVNWTATTVAPRLRALALASIGQARAELLAESQQVARDDALRAGRIANAGTVEAVAALPRGDGRYVVVTRERTSSAVTDAYRGLAPEWHVSLATVARTAGGLWVLSDWQPES